MNATTLLNRLHKTGLVSLVAFVCSLGYKLKGFGTVPVRYKKNFRAYEFYVNGYWFLSMGPGWAYSFEYLHKAIQASYNYFYTPGKGDVVIDIGAGLGEESLIYSKLVGENGTVLSVEANCRTFDALSYITAKNKIKNVKLFNKAIYGVDDKLLKIEDDGENYLGNTIGTNQTEAGYDVTSITLDTLVKLSGVTRIDFLKCNIEGAEKFLIEGMHECLSVLQNACISCHDFRHVHHKHGEFYITKETVMNFFLSNGFDVSQRSTGNPLLDDYLYVKRR